MGRVFFPTYSLNRFGVRDTQQRATLHGMNGGAVERFPAEPTPRAAMTPTGPMLGSVVWQAYGNVNVPMEVPYNLPPGAIFSGTPWPGVNARPIVYNPDGIVPPGLINDARQMVPISSSGGGGAVSSPNVSAPASREIVPAAAAPVSAQVGPTPTVTLPPPSRSSMMLVTSGGGTQTPSTPTVTAPAQSAGFVDNIAAWLGGSTTLFNYKVPNALLAGAVILGFAWLSSGSGKKR